MKGFSFKLLSILFVMDSMFVSLAPIRLRSSVNRYR